jgi:hypothetical protein
MIAMVFRLKKWWRELRRGLCKCRGKSNTCGAKWAIFRLKLKNFSYYFALVYVFWRRGIGILGDATPLLLG